jgi:hypothetical protein
MTPPSDKLKGKTEAALVEAPPRPTYAPATMALSIMFTIWGILTHWTMSLAGVGLLIFALGMWINEVRHEWSEH